MTRSPKLIARQCAVSADHGEEPAGNAARRGAESVEGLRARAAELERRNQELDRFAGTVGHELRAPLVAADGYLALLQQDLGDALHDAAREDFERLRREMRHMRALAETLLQHARSGAEPPSRRLVSVRLVAADCLALLEPMIAASGAEVSVGPLPVVNADARMLGIVITNLVTNALRYGLREGGFIHISGRRMAGRARIEVDNHGRTIDAAERSRIFAPFARSRGERRADGVGLGLTICRSIVERHGGSIGVEPLPCGNRFWFVLPD
jgi:signal transduction histidine kinase